jgi:hypothetical protein
MVAPPPLKGRTRVNHKSASVTPEIPPTSTSKAAGTGNTRRCKPAMANKAIPKYIISTPTGTIDPRTYRTFIGAQFGRSLLTFSITETTDPSTKVLEARSVISNPP